MALTLGADQRMEAAGFGTFFEEDRGTWLDAARQTRKFIMSNFPAGARIRRDDVAKALIPILEVNEDLRDKLNEDRLRAKYWINDFADLILDRTWDELEKEMADDEKAKSAG